MADDILKNIPLPADLPENWTSGQTIAPTGAEVGLDNQHGYNYLMRQVNNAQKALKALAAQREEDLARIKFWASNDPTSPASFIGGTWERIEGRFIMGASDTYPAGSTGGSAEHYHNVGLRYLVGTNVVIGGSDNYSITTIDMASGSSNPASPAVKDTEYNANLYGPESLKLVQYSMYRSYGTTTREKSLPPYYSVYIWRRVA